MFNNHDHVHRYRTVGLDQLSNNWTFVTIFPAESLECSRSRYPTIFEPFCGYSTEGRDHFIGSEEIGATDTSKRIFPAQQMPSPRPQYGMQCTSSRGNSRYCKKVNEVAPNYNSSRIWRKNALK